MNIILLGAPGSGKGTLSFELIKKFKYNHIAPGDIFRSNIKNQTPLGQKISSIVNSGNLVSDELVTEVVENYILEKNIKDNIILDGFPRTIGQAKLLSEMFKKLNLKLDYAIYLDVDKETILERLANRRVCPKCGATYNIKTKPVKVAGICDNCGTEIIQRNDDKVDVIETRFNNYVKITSPLFDHYKDLNILITWKDFSFENMLDNFQILNNSK